jgi:hypothetical protein
LYRITQVAPHVFEQGYPTAETSQRARDDADFQRAVTAYRFWCPTVSVEGNISGRALENCGTLALRNQLVITI